MADKGDMIVLIDDTGFYEDWMYNRALTVKSSEYHGVFVEGYDRMIPHSDYKIFKKKLYLKY